MENKRVLPAARTGQSRGLRHRRVFGILSAMGLMSATALIGAERFSNSFVTVEGDGVRIADDGSIHFPNAESPVSVEVTARPGWKVNGKKSLSLIRAPGASGPLRVTSDLGEDSDHIPLEDCQFGSVVSNRHVSPPAISVNSAGALAMYALPQTNILVSVSASCETVSYGVHETITKWLPCPVCHAAHDPAEEKVQEEIAPGAQIWTASAAGVETNSNTWTGYMTKGRGQQMSFRVVATNDCRKCICEASTNVVVDVYELSVTNDLYIGLDRTDAGRTNPVIKAGTAVIDPGPSGTVTYTWTDCGIYSFTGRTDQATVRYFVPDPDVRSGAYPLTVAAAIEDGDLTASATCTTNFTVVKVGVEIGGVDEDKEEKKGLFLQYVPDTTNGLITVEGTNQMVSVALTCEPIDLPTSEMVTVSCSGPGELYEELSSGELVLISATNYPACELASHDFWLHAHGVSSSMRDGAITIMHETSGAKDEARYTCVSIDWIKASCDKLPDAGSFGSNPEVFEGPCVDFGQPDALPPHWWEPGTYRDPKSKALKIFFKYVKDANDKPSDFTVKFDAQVRPSDFAQICEMEWTQTDGPDAIEPSNVHGTHAEVKNPKKTVLYKYRLTASYDTFSVPSEAWFMMPRAGGEISGWLAKEIPIAISRAHDWYDKVCTNCVLRGMTAKDADTFARGTAWRYIASCEFDYQGVAGDPTPRYSYTDADRPEGEVEGFMGKGQGNDFDEPSYATLSGIVVHRAKVNNLLFCVWARVLGYSTNSALRGADFNAIMRGQWGDNDSSQAAIGFGGVLYDKSIAGEDLALLITKEKAKAMQTPDSADGLNDVNLWPNCKSASDGFRFKPMPTDYDTLSKGDQSSSDRGS